MIFAARSPSRRVAKILWHEVPSRSASPLVRGSSGHDTRRRYSDEHGRADAAAASFTRSCLEGFGEPSPSGGLQGGGKPHCSAIWSSIRSALRFERSLNCRPCLRCCSKNRFEPPALTIKNRMTRSSMAAKRKATVNTCRPASALPPPRMYVTFSMFAGKNGTLPELGQHNRKILTGDGAH